MKRSVLWLAAAYSLLAAVMAPVTSYAQEKEFRYEKAVQAYEKASEENPPTAETTFFVGSSTFTRWKNIPTDFAEFNAVNRGFGGSKLVDWNNVATARLLAPYKPARVVLYCGGNDMTGGASAQTVLERFKTFLADLRAANPDVKLHVCSIHNAPHCEKDWPKFAEYNAAIKKMAEEDPNIYFIDFNGAVLAEDGSVREELYVQDKVHLTREGEEILVPLVIESIHKEIQDAVKPRQ